MSGRGKRLRGRFGGHMLKVMKTRISQLPARLRGLGLFLIALCWPGIAWAQIITPPKAPHLSKAPAVWLGLLVMFFLLVPVVFVSLMPSKRGHQD